VKIPELLNICQPLLVVTGRVFHTTRYNTKGYAKIMLALYIFCLIFI
jgi:hypothetical protein